MRALRLRDTDQDQTKTNRPKALEPSAGEERNHLWAVAVPAVVKAARCVSNRTRPVSWLGSTSFGTHPRTKGARCSAGGHRHRIPSTRGVSRRLAAAQACQASGDPSSSTGALRSMESRQRRFAEERPSRLADPSRGSETRTPLQKEACAGESRETREVGPAVGNGRRGAGIRRRQDALREARCLRDAPRLPVEVSTGCVPLQSG